MAQLQASRLILASLCAITPCLLLFILQDPGDSCTRRRYNLVFMWTGYVKTWAINYKNKCYVTISESWVDRGSQRLNTYTFSSLSARTLLIHWKGTSKWYRHHQQKGNRLRMHIHVSTGNGGKGDTFLSFPCNQRLITSLGSDFDLNLKSMLSW